MLGYEEAVLKILDNCLPLGTEEVALEKLAGRVLAVDVVAPFDFPRFDNSAVDGFGVIVADVTGATEQAPVKLPLSAVLRAGDPGEMVLSASHGVKILTGGVVPGGVEAVVMREYCREENGSVHIGYTPTAGENIRPRGAEYKQGETLLRRGMVATPPVVGMVASVGLSAILVSEQPRVAVISTGNEIVAPGVQLKPGQIYDSNSFALGAAIREFGIETVNFYHAPEDRDQTEVVLRQALAENDVIVSAGGVSVGDFDFVTQVCKEMGVQELIWKIAIKPGKPVYVGLVPGVPGAPCTPQSTTRMIFGLPGNPVSALVTLNLFVRPALRKMMGVKENDQRMPRFTARLEKDVRKRPGRMEFVRGELFCGADSDELRVKATTGQDSHMLGGLCNANCLIHFGKDESLLSAGESVVVELLPWNF